MHIVFLSSEYPQINYPHGGVGTFIRTLSRWLVKHDVNVSVIGINTNLKDQFENDHGVEVHRLRSIRFKGLSWIFNSYLINKKIDSLNNLKKIDIIEGSELSLAFLKKNKKIKYLIRMHGGHHFFSKSENRKINLWKGLQERYSFYKADAVIGVSNYVINHTLNYFDFKDKVKGVINNPANIDKFYLSDPKKAIKGRIFFAGTVCEKKGIRQLIEAMHIVKKTKPDAHLIVAGRDWHFPKTKKSYIEYLKTSIDASMVESITFLGNIPNSKIPELIEKSEICCYPSHMEAMPLAWIEVMSMKKAFITSHLGPGTEIIEHGVNGILCNPLDPKNIAEKIIYVFNNKEKVDLLVEKAYRHAVKNFNLDYLGEKNRNLYSSLI